MDKYILQTEFDDEPSYIVTSEEPDVELITIAAGNSELAKRIVDFLNKEGAE